MAHTVTKEQINETLITGLREFIKMFEDGLYDITHWEHYSEDPCNGEPKIYHLHIQYKKEELDALR